MEIFKFQGRVVYDDCDSNGLFGLSRDWDLWDWQSMDSATLNKGLETHGFYFFVVLNKAIILAETLWKEGLKCYVLHATENLNDDGKFGVAVAFV